MKKIIISVEPWQTKIAILHQERLQNIYFSSPHDLVLERNFFKGVVTKILPGIQTAFVDINQEKAGFLHISEIDRELSLARMKDSILIEEDETEEETSQHQPKNTQRTPPDISKILVEKEPILVQVSKEPVYEKGAKLTTCFTLPGRFVVLMPNIPRLGISKKIENRDERIRLKKIVAGSIPEGMGAIIRTCSENASEDDIVRDLAYLVHTWHTILDRYNSAKPTEKIYQDLNLMLAVVRDNLDSSIEAIVSNSKTAHDMVYNFVKEIAPEYSHLIKLYTGQQDILTRFNINTQIEQSLQKKQTLKSGGSIIIETTEAMTVIDVNTGKFTGTGSLEETVLETNLEAAEEIVRQLRLRNIGGLIVIDFIDMASSQSRNKLYRFLEQTLKENDKFQSVVLKVSEFGLVQMTRKRSGKTLAQQLMINCPTCHSLGIIKSIKTECYALLSKLKTELEVKKASKVEVYLNGQMFNHLTSVEYDSVLDLERQLKCQIMLSSSNDLQRHEYKIIVSE